MPNKFQEFTQHLLDRFRALPWPMRVSVMTALVFLLGALIFYSAMPDKTSYAPMFSGLDSSDAAEITAKLKEQQIPYKLDAMGSTILVPEASVYELRLRMAQEGLPKGGGVGLEIFDKPSFGQSDFIQQKNYIRALQGELERTISSMPAVLKARVHLVLPEKRLFRDSQDQASASVMIKLKSGKTLQDSQVQGMIHLVASSVAGLSPERVTLLDDSGQVLSLQGDKVKGMMASVWDYKRQLERTYENNIRTMLEKVVGASHVSVQVSAQVDSNQIERTEETYDPASVSVRSEQMNEEQSSNTTPNIAGVPGARTNLPGGAPPEANTTNLQNANKKSYTKNYEVNRVVNHTVAAPVRLERLSVAVLVDGVYQKNESGQKYLPRTTEEIDNLLAVTKQAMGFNQDRGDQVELRNVQFLKDEDTQTLPQNPYAQYWIYGAVLGVLLVGALVTTIVVIKKRQSVLEPVIVQEYPRPLKEMEALLHTGNEEEERMTQQLLLLPRRVQDVVNQDGLKAASVIRTWLNEVPKIESAAESKNANEKTDKSKNATSQKSAGAHA